MVLVGAINVAAIETVWHGLVTPPQSKYINRYVYRDKPVTLKQGQEMGRFNMGSTVILLTGANFQWQAELGADTPVKLGQPLATVTD
jgi:phosphatidylserine decarboxylase